jgi:hypothetical protein
MMSPPAKRLVATAAFLLAASAEAQLLPNLDMIHRAVTDQVHGKPVGTTASWSLQLQEVGINPARQKSWLARSNNTRK